MATWITDRTQSDVDRVKELHKKAVFGTWTSAEQSEWAAGMKGALSYSDFNRIQKGMAEIASVVGASITAKTNWAKTAYLSAADASRWISNVKEIRSKCSGMASTPSSPSKMAFLTFSGMNDIEKILSDIEALANDHNCYVSEVICGGDFP